MSASITQTSASERQQAGASAPRRWPARSHPPTAQRPLRVGAKLGRGAHPLPVPARRWAAVYGSAAMVALTAAVVLALVGLANVGGVSSAPASGPAVLEFVRSGETLSGLAARAMPDRPIAETVRRIIELNGLRGAAVQAGQALLVPVPAGAP